MIIYPFLLNNILAAGFVITSFLLLLFFFFFRNGFDQGKELFEGPCQNLLVALWHFSVISPVTQRLLISKVIISGIWKKFCDTDHKKSAKQVAYSSKFLHHVAHRWTFVLSAAPVTALTCCNYIQQTLLVAALLQQGSRPQKVYDF